MIMKKINQIFKTRMILNKIKVMKIKIKTMMKKKINNNKYKMNNNLNKKKKKKNNKKKN